MKLLRKVIEGFAFGIGLSIATAVVYTIYMFWALPAVFEHLASERRFVSPAELDEDEWVTAAPALTPSSGYLGSSGTYSDRFDMDGYSGLAPGPGRIAGLIVSGEQPVRGLRIRLGLNGSVMTQWGESDAQGRYEIPVPAGDYRVDAFEIDTTGANRLLAGKIQRPGGLILGHAVSVAPESAGAGPRFEFVDPVRKRAPTGTVTGTADIVIEWHPFPGATVYELQLYKIPDPGDYSSVEPLFSYRERPRVTESSASLANLGVRLEPGMGYRYTVAAYDGRRIISETHEDYARPDFSIAE